MQASSTTAIPRLKLPHQRRAVVVADLVESVRLIKTDEAGVIERWSRFVATVRGELLPARGGRMVKSLGDGFLLVFDLVPSAAAAALELHRRIADENVGHGEETALRLRVAVNVGEVFEDSIDAYGDAVNVAARLATLAAPGETVISSAIRECLVPGVDPDVEDLGDCFLKHIEGPVRVFRLGPAPLAPLLEPVHSKRRLDLRPSIAVVPFDCSYGQDTDATLGEALADEVIAHLAHCAELHVISGLSTRRVKGRKLTVDEIAGHLGAAYVVSGRYQLTGTVVQLRAQMTDARNLEVLWVDSRAAPVQHAFDPESSIAGRVADRVGRSILERELERASNQPLQALESYTLLFGAIGLMHRLSLADFTRARDLLEALAYRNARSSLPHAWLAKWHVLRAAQGWSENVAYEALKALREVDLALSINPQNSLALAVGGHVHGYLRGDQKEAWTFYQDALAANPNEPLAWLWTSVWHAYRGDGRAAADAAEMALRLSPLDPMKYYFESLAATALLAGGAWERAEALARRSIRANRMHASSWRTLAIALVPQGKMDDAFAAVSSLLTIEPRYTVARFNERFPGRDGPMAAPWAEALASAGLPR